MNIWVAAVLVMAVASLAYSYHRQVSYSIVGSVICVASYAVLVASAGSTPYLLSDTMDGLAFRPGDLVDPARAYTLVTSMYTHAGITHLLVNVLCLIFLGSAFEQRIGTRPFIIIFLITGLCGTLLFAAMRWDTAVGVVGASGAISGILGAFTRMFPNERMSLFLMFFPLPPMRIWVIVVLFLLLQLVFVWGDMRIAVEAHLGGLVAGMVISPYIVRIPLHRRVKRMVSQNALRKLATTPELRSIMRRIEQEEIPDVKSAWIEHFLSRARCPACGSALKVRKEGVICEKGHLL